MIVKKLFENNGELYVILREIPYSNIMKKDGNINSEIFNGWKEYLEADHVLKTQSHFLFCKRVEDAVYEEVKQQELIKEETAIN